ncbi:hypothetical protein HDE_02068 [Halotydeus destructor]|nr:hypothetical protein HDE_02068 [Halotydeus destructor]
MATLRLLTPICVLICLAESATIKRQSQAKANVHPISAQYLNSPPLIHQMVNSDIPHERSETQEVKSADGKASPVVRLWIHSETTPVKDWSDHYDPFASGTDDAAPVFAEVPQDRSQEQQAAKHQTKGDKRRPRLEQAVEQQAEAEMNDSFEERFDNDGDDPLDTASSRRPKVASKRLVKRDLHGQYEGDYDTPTARLDYEEDNGQIEFDDQLATFDSNSYAPPEPQASGRRIFLPAYHEYQPGN